MISGIVAGRFIDEDAGTPYVHSGAGAYQNETDTFAAGVAYTWPSQRYDTAGYFTPGGSLMTVPEAGLYRATASLYGLDSDYIRLEHNSVQEYGTGYRSCRETTPGFCVVARPFLCAAGDTFRIVNNNATNTHAANYGGNDGRCWFNVQKLADGVKRCVVRKNANQALVAATGTNATWQTELVDDGGWFDAGVSEVNLVVPAGVNLIRLSMGGAASNTTDNNYFVMRAQHNDAYVYGMPHARTNQATKHLCAMGAPIEVVPGDTVRVRVWSQLAGNLNLSNATWLSVEEVKDVKERVLVYPTVAQVIAGGAAATVLNFAGEVYKTQPAMHSTVSNTGRLIVPAGCTRARLIACIRGTGTVADAVYSRKNGNMWEGGHFYLTGDNEFERTGWTDWCSAVEGDYFDVLVDPGAGSFTIDTTLGYCWACLECI